MAHHPSDDRAVCHLTAIEADRQSPVPAVSACPGATEPLHTGVRAMGSQRTVRSLARLVGVTMLATFVALPAGSSTASAASGDLLTSLHVDGDPGDPVSEGKTFVLDAADAAVVTSVRDAGNYVLVQFTPDSPGGALGDYPWTVELEAPAGWPLVAGDYDYVPHAAQNGPGQAGMFISGNGFSFGRDGCTQLQGSFTIHEIDVTANTLNALSATFTQSCAETSAILYGGIRYHAPGGFKAADARPFTVDFGGISTGSRSPTKTVTLRAIGSMPVQLGHAFIHGPDENDFRIESNTCEAVLLAPGGATCEITVSALPVTNRQHDAVLQVGDDTRRGARLVPLVVNGVGDVSATAEIGPDTFYPVVDGYLDTLRVTGVRDEPVAVRVDIGDVSTGGSVLLSLDEPAGTGPFLIEWNGLDHGSMAHPGEYDITAILTDADGNKARFTKRVTLSVDYWTWHTVTQVRDGKRFSYWGVGKNGLVSVSRSSYAKGVRLESGRGWATIIYQFPVKWAKWYGGMTFEVYGRSPNGHKGVMALWNPKLGGFRYLDHYDASRKIGPRAQWYKRRVNGDGRRQNGYARATVMVWKGLGGAGSATFDVEKVRLTYDYAVWHAVSLSSAESGPAPRAAPPPSSAGKALVDVPRLPTGVLRRQVDSVRTWTDQPQTPEPSPSPAPSPEPPVASLVDPNEPADDPRSDEAGVEDEAGLEVPRSDALSGPAPEPSPELEPPVTE